MWVGEYEGNLKFDMGVYNIKFHFWGMAEEEILYGVGTMTEIKKKMTGKPVAKSHDLNSEMLT